MHNYCNIVSNATSPSRPNQNQFVTLSSASTDSWKVQGKDLICMTPGVWQFTVQYQLLNIKSVDTGFDARFDGWFNVNGKNVKESAACSFASKIDGTAVLTNALSFDFKKGDRVKFGARSESQKDLNIVCSSIQTDANVVAPALIATAIRVPSKSTKPVFEGNYFGTGSLYITNLDTATANEQKQTVQLEVKKLADQNYYMKFVEITPFPGATFSCVAVPSTANPNFLQSATSGLDSFYFKNNKLYVSLTYNIREKLGVSGVLEFTKVNDHRPPVSA